MKKLQLKTVFPGITNALSRAEMKKISGGTFPMDCFTASPGTGPGACRAGFICCADLKCYSVAAGCPS